MFSAGHFSTEQLDLLIDNFSREADQYYFTNTSEANLIRIISANIDRISFLDDCLRYPAHIEILTAIAANSNYLTDIVVRNPGYLYQVLNIEYLKSELTEDYLVSEISKGLCGYKLFVTKINFLRNYKRRITLKIGLRDILGYDELNTTTHYISILAKSICAQLFSLCYNELKLKNGTVRVGSKYTLASLGKLGGSELNYSSDIDLIIFYDKNRKIKENLDFHRLIIETIQLFVKSCSEITSNGYLYRVDFRLRPDGEHSPLARSLYDYLKYYEARGENWERQMLIKLGFIGGNRKLFEKFFNMLKPFVYPSSFLTSPLEQIRKMKNDMERRSGENENIKLFSGGIRDIEFSVQALQLLNGGKIEELQNRNTLCAIKLLGKNGLLNKQESDTLVNAYTFYRKIEHYLQLMNDRQTHTIPAVGDLPLQLSKYLGFGTIRDFQNKVSFCQVNIKKIYDSITKPGINNKSNLTIIFDGINFADHKRGIKNYRYLQSGTGIFEQKKFDAKTSNSFNKIEGNLISYLVKTSQADLILENFAKIIRNINFPSMWYSEFTNTKFFYDFLFICEFSQRAVDELSTDRFSSELFITRKVFSRNIYELFNIMQLNQIVFILTIQFTLKLISQDKFSKLLSECIETKARSIIGSEKLPYKFFVGGVGSFGTKEMSFASDIDLLFISGLPNAEINIQNDFQRIFLKLQSELKPFKVDARLRPEGNNSPLAWDINSYADYLSARARVWEFQSLLKLRFVAGDKDLFNDFKKNIIKSLACIKKKKIQTEIIEMHKNILKQEASAYSNEINIKKSPGGLRHIDFLTDSLILVDPKNYKNCLGKNVSKKILYLIKNCNSANDLNKLTDNYMILRNVKLVVQNTLASESSVLPGDILKLNLLDDYLKFPKNKNIKCVINNILISSSKIIEKFWSE